MNANQCWAFNKQRQRCEEVAGHEDEHRISVAWTDEECFDPDIDALVTFVDKPVPFAPTAGGQILSNAPADVADEPDPATPCFSCGVPYGVHDDDNPEGCRSFIE
ncbi:MAG: hypothetical protein ACOYB3_01800 [Azonexus sp.]